MNKLITFLVIAFTLFSASCKKQVCFKCRDGDYAAVYVKGTDTIFILGNASGTGIKELIDSGYTVPYHTNIWQDNYVIICNDEGVKTFLRDSCVRQ